MRAKRKRLVSRRGREEENIDNNKKKKREEENTIILDLLNTISREMRFLSGEYACKRFFSLLYNVLEERNRSILSTGCLRFERNHRFRLATEARFLHVARHRRRPNL